MAATVKGLNLSGKQGVAVLRAALNVIDRWKGSSEQACRILWISQSMYTRAKQADPKWSVSLDSDQLQRISLVLNIHAALRAAFDNPDNVYGFPSMKNQNEFFKGRSPLEIMAEGDVTSLYETFKRIEALRVS